MKKQSVKGLAFIAVAGSIVASCDIVKDLKYTVTPNPLEMHGDSVRVKVDVTFPEKGIKKKASAVVTPMLGDIALKPVTVLGEKATGNGTVIQYKPGGKVIYEDVIAYNPSLEACDLTVNGKVYKGGKEKTKENFGPIKIADATIITPLLVNKDFKVIYEKDNFQRVTEQVYTAQINYEKAKSNVRPTELKDADMKALEAWLAAANTNAKIAIKTVNITGFASPEGEIGTNNSLSSDRTATAKETTKSLALKAKNNAAQGEIFNTIGRGEDWEGFKKELKASSLNEDEKQLIIRVLEMYTDPVQREQEMKNMSKTFTFLEKNILPKLRRSEIGVVYDLTGYSDEELVALSKSTIDSLDLEELLFTATLVNDLNDKLAIYNHAISKYPSDHRAINNAGVVLYMQNKLAEAKAKFEEANGIKDNSISKNNLAAIAGVQGDRKKAAELLKQASGAGSEVSYNLGILNIMDGKYADAVNNLGENNFNKALAQLLNGAIDQAIKTVDASKDKESAQGYYLKAIAAAKSGKIEGVVSNLKSSIALDKKFKEKAAKDREFLVFFENPSFTSIVK